MIFKKFIAYNLSKDFSLTAEKLAEALEKRIFAECQPTMAFSAGWVPTFEFSDDLLCKFDDYGMCTLRRDSKSVPAALVREILEEKIAEFEEKTGEKPEKADKESMKEDIILDLLPKAFAKTALFQILFNFKTGEIFIQAPAARAEEALSIIRDALGSFPAIPFGAALSEMAPVASQWLTDGDYPEEGLSVESECTIKGNDGETIQCKKIDLYSDQVVAHVKSGRFVTKIALGINDEAMFVLDEKFSFGRIKSMETLNGTLADAIESAEGDPEREIFLQLQIEAALLESMTKAISKVFQEDEE